MIEQLSNSTTTNGNIRKLRNVKRKRGSYRFAHEFVTESVSRGIIGKIEALEVLRGRPAGTTTTRGSVLGSSTPLWCFCH